MTDVELSSPIGQKIINNVKKIFILLVNQKYGELEAWTKGNNWSAEDMRSCIESYNATFILPPAGFYEKYINILKIRKESLKSELEPEYAVRIPLFSREEQEEGQSDLSLDLVLTDIDNQQQMGVELINIIVF